MTDARTIAHEYISTCLYGLHEEAKTHSTWCDRLTAAIQKLLDAKDREIDGLEQSDTLNRESAAGYYKLYRDTVGRAEAAEARVAELELNLATAVRAIKA